MSAPATAEYSPLTPFFILLAESAIAEVEQMGAEYAETLETLKLKAAARIAERQQEAAARAARLADFEAQAERLTARYLRLSGLAQQGASAPPLPASLSASLSAPLSELPVAPVGAEAANATAWGAYVQQLEAALADLEARLDSEADANTRQILATVMGENQGENLGERLDLQGMLDLYLAQRQAERDVAERAAWRRMIEQTLARLDLPPGESLPVRIETLARAVILAETSMRAELLGRELQREVQLYRAGIEQAKQDAAQAADWLQRFAIASGFPASEAVTNAADGALIECLHAVAAGLLPLDAAMRQTITRRVQEIDEAIRAREGRAAALVLEQSLRDLGYQVEAVRETLFAEGGMLHFQRPGWGAYQVRLRVSVREKHFNFNVVRAKNDDANRDVAAQKKQDFIAEERWCAEFPRLLATLAARGLKLNIIRQLEAGELPVQEVDADRLPRFANEPEPMRRNAPKRLDLPKETP
jgi:hypothetical protein